MQSPFKKNAADAAKVFPQLNIIYVCRKCSFPPEVRLPFPQIHSRLTCGDAVRSTSCRFWPKGAEDNEEIRRPHLIGK